MKGKKFLVIDDTAIGKAAIENMLTQSAANKKNIFYAKNFAKALEILDQERPNYIFSKFLIENDLYESVLDQHLKMMPNRLHCGFIVISENDSIEVATRVAQSEVNRMVLVPYTINTLQQEFLKVVIPKATPDPYLTEIELAKEFLKIDPDRSLNHLSRAKKLKSHPLEAYFYEGVILCSLKSLENARTCFEEALKINPLHFQSLTELFKIFVQKDDHQRAYRIGGILLENYPVNPSLIPTLTRLSIACAKYDDVFTYHEAYKKVLRPDPDMKNYIAASLSIYGKKIIQDQFKYGKNLPPDVVKKGISVVETAASICEGRPLIFASILETLKDAGEPEKLNKILTIAIEQFPESNELRILEVVAFNYDAKPADGLKRAVDMIKSGPASPHLYEIILSRAVELKLSERIISEHLQNAIKTFPERKEFFLSIIKQE